MVTFASGRATCEIGSYQRIWPSVGSSIPAATCSATTSRVTASSTACHSASWISPRSRRAYSRRCRCASGRPRSGDRSRCSPGSSACRLHSPSRDLSVTTGRPRLPAAVPFVQAVPEPDLAAPRTSSTGSPRAGRAEPGSPPAPAPGPSAPRRGPGSRSTFFCSSEVVAASRTLWVRQNSWSRRVPPASMTVRWASWRAPAQSPRLGVAGHQAAHRGLEPRDEPLGLLGREVPLRVALPSRLYPRTIRGGPPRTRRALPGGRGRPASGSARCRRSGSGPVTKTTFAPAPGVPSACHASRRTPASSSVAIRRSAPRTATWHGGSSDTARPLPDPRGQDHAPRLRDGEVGRGEPQPGRRQPLAAAPRAPDPPPAPATPRTRPAPPRRAARRRAPPRPATAAPRSRRSARRARAPRPARCPPRRPPSRPGARRRRPARPRRRSAPAAPPAGRPPPRGSPGPRPAGRPGRSLGAAANETPRPGHLPADFRQEPPARGHCGSPPAPPVPLPPRGEGVTSPPLLPSTAR